MENIQHNGYDTHPENFDEYYFEDDLGYYDHYEDEDDRYESAAGVSAGAAVAGLTFNILSSAMTTFTKGDLKVVMPNGPIGVTASGIPRKIRSQLKTVRPRARTIFKYRKTNPISGIEQVNIQLTCRVQYNGPSVQATFGFAAGGTRSRLMRDSKVTIRNPLSLERQPTSSAWRKVGINVYPVVTIPIEVSVDHPWPQSNDHWTFDLVISGMYGFGRKKGHRAVRNMRHVKN